MWIISSIHLVFINYKTIPVSHTTFYYEFDILSQVAAKSKGDVCNFMIL